MRPVPGDLHNDTLVTRADERAANVELPGCTRRFARFVVGNRRHRVVGIRWFAARLALACHEAWPTPVVGGLKAALMTVDRRDRSIPRRRGVTGSSLSQQERFRH